jgi:hypothetical protein
VAGLLFAALFIVDIRSLKALDRKSVIVYVVSLLPCVYLALVFATNVPWPHFGDLLRAVYGWPARQVVGLLDVTP